MGTIPSGYYLVQLDLQNDQINARVQRSYDGSWLGSDSNWYGAQRDAVSLVDSTYDNAGQVIIGGNW
jgi:hypothetical protein